MANTPPPPPPPGPPAGSGGGYPAGPPTFWAPDAQSTAPLIPPSPPQPKKPATWVWVVAGAFVLTVVIAAVALAMGDSSGPANGLPSAANPELLTPTTFQVTDVAEQPVTVTGDPIPAGGNVDGAAVPVIEGFSFDERPVTITPDRPTVVVVMAHWCPHCQAEIPRIVEAYESGQLPDGVRIVGVATANDPAKGNFPPAQWLADEGWPFEVLVDSAEGEVLEALGVSGFPTVVAIGSDGTVKAHVSGENELSTLQSIWSAALGATSN